MREKRNVSEKIVISTDNDNINEVVVNDSVYTNALVNEETITEEAEVINEDVITEDVITEDTVEDPVGNGRLINADNGVDAKIEADEKKDEDTRKEIKELKDRLDEIKSLINDAKTPLVYVEEGIINKVANHYADKKNVEDAVKAFFMDFLGAWGNNSSNGPIGVLYDMSNKFNFLHESLDVKKINEDVKDVDEDVIDLIANTLGEPGAGNDSYEAIESFLRMFAQSNNSVIVALYDVADEIEDALDLDEGFSEELEEAIENVVNIYGEIEEDPGDAIRFVIQDLLECDAKTAKEAIIELSENADDYLSFNEDFNKLSLSEETFDEAIPRDLSKAYHHARYSGEPDSDLQNADYTEITPDEAYRIIKKEGAPRLLRLLVDGQLIKLKPDGYGSMDSHFRNQWVSHDKWYYKKNGDSIKDTAYMPIKHLLKIADKIYVTNEEDVKKDQELLRKRLENPESKLGKRSFDKSRARSNINTSKGRGDPYDLPWNISGQRKDWANNIKKYQERISELDQQFANGNIDEYTYHTRRKDYLDSIEWVKHSIGNYHDARSRLRYINSEKDLQKNLVRYNELKYEIDDQKEAVERATNNLEDVKTNGAQTTRQARREYDKLKDELFSIKRKLAVLDFELENANEADIAAVNAAQDKLNSYIAQFNASKAELNRILRR